MRVFLSESIVERKYIKEREIAYLEYNFIERGIAVLLAQFNNTE
jgi:hypothetical protein